MKEKDNEMLTRFFDEHRQHIADNGFSRRVMQRLPDTSIVQNRLWTAFCCLLGILFFIYTRAWEQFMPTLQSIYEPFRAAVCSIQLTSFTPLAIIIILFTFMAVTVYNLSMDQD